MTAVQAQKYELEVITAAEEGDLIAGICRWGEEHAIDLLIIDAGGRTGYNRFGRVAKSSRVQ